jgi:hypothetical protein
MKKYFNISKKQTCTFENVCCETCLIRGQDVVSNRYSRKFKSISLFSRRFFKHGGEEWLKQYEICLDGDRSKRIFITFSYDNTNRADMVLVRLLGKINPYFGVIDMCHQVHRDTVISQG